MKIVYSHLQKLLPQLEGIDPKTIADKLSWLGHFTSSVQSTSTDTVIDLEVRQNRADCLGYFGIACDLSPLYGPVNLKEYRVKPNVSLPKPTITIDSKDVLRIQAISISNIKNISSPNWLKSFLIQHDINPINGLVDLTNYIMLLYGIPCHAFDADKVKNQLTWQNNHQTYMSFTSLDSTKLDLQKKNLLITSQGQVVSLSFIGGINSGVQLSTKNIIIEMAVYNRSRVRSDSRGLKIITEASIRLDKYLDCNLIPRAFAHLNHLILDLIGGKISTKLFDHYPTPQTSPIIRLNPAQISNIAGVNIESEFCKQTLISLGCQINENEDYLMITPPSLRKDLNIEEDLIEEVIRFYGYDNIPTDQPISNKKLPDITPKIIYLIKSLKDKLVQSGYNEIKSWPLIQQKHIIKRFLNSNQQVVYAENSVNQKYPVLRHTIISSLINQSEQYQKYKLDNTSFFEIGKIFYQVGDKYVEKYSLGIFNPNPNKLKQDVDSLDLIKPNQTLKNDTGLYVEYILDDQKTSNIKTQIYDEPRSQAAIELTQQITILDANLTLNNKRKPREIIKKYSQKIGKHLWQIRITDIYHNSKDNSYKYTFRVSYYNLSSAKAKKLHLDTFDLN